MPRNRQLLLSAQSQVLLDPGIARDRRLQRQRTLHVSFIPRMRALGFAGIVGLVSLHEFARTGQAWSPGLTLLTLYCVAYAVTSRRLLWRRFRPEDGPLLPRVFLAGDLTVGAAAIYLTGGAASWLVFLPYVRVADQIMEGARWCMTLFALAALTHAGSVLGHAALEGATLDLRIEAAKLVGCMAAALHVAWTSRGAEVRLGHGRASLELARRYVRDLSEKSDALEDAMEVKERFLANMSHELRTPMNGIIGMAQLALDTELDREQEDYVLTIQRSAVSLLAIVNDILEHSRLEAGKVQFERAEFSLVECLSDALALTAGAGFDKGLEVVCDLAHDVPIRVLGDAARLRQVLVNLLGNAVKFTEHGFVRVDVARVESGGDLLRFRVEDTGLGMSSDVLETIFEPFTQAEATITRRFGGTGLGLSIARELAVSMDGDLRVASRQGEGSVFTLELDLSSAAVSAESIAEIGGRRVHVLVRSPRLAEVVAGVLGDHGVQTLWHGSHASLVEALETDANGGALWIAEEAGPDDAAAQQRFFGSHRCPGVFLHARSLPREVKGEAGVHHVRLPFVGPELIAALRGAVAAHALELGPGDSRAPLRRPEGTPTVSTRGRVLVVEDNPVNQRITKKLVENLGYTVELHSNGLDAVTDLCRTDADRNVVAILMDLQMPIMDGLEATRRLRAYEARHPRLEPLQIVAMTANTAKEDRDACIYAGMDGFLGKPVERAELNRTLMGSEDARVGARDAG